MAIPWFEPACFVILALSFAARVRLGGWRRFLRDAAILAIGALLAEESAMHLFEFYGYAAWSLKIDRMPVMVMLIWPFVISSARDLRDALAPDDRSWRRYVAISLLVIADAALIEPVAVHAGLWRWTVPGIFGVPVIGILGWGLYAGFAVALLEKLPKPARLLTIPLATIATHLSLVALWWGALRGSTWREFPAPALAILSLAAGASLCAGILSKHLAVHPLVMLPRAIAASLFFVLIGRAPARWLVIWSIGFVPAPTLLTWLGVRGATARVQA